MHLTEVFNWFLVFMCAGSSPAPPVMWDTRQLCAIKHCFIAGPLHYHLAGKHSLIVVAARQADGDQRHARLWQMAASRVSWTTKQYKKKARITRRVLPARSPNWSRGSSGIVLDQMSPPLTSSLYSLKIIFSLYYMGNLHSAYKPTCIWWSRILFKSIGYV